jgi:hypothetical protein
MAPNTAAGPQLGRELVECRCPEHEVGERLAGHRDRPPEPRRRRVVDHGLVEDPGQQQVRVEVIERPARLEDVELVGTMPDLEHPRPRRASWRGGECEAHHITLGGRVEAVDITDVM